jgi:hypothetical protein
VHQRLQQGKGWGYPRTPYSFTPGPPCPTLLRPAGRPPPYGRFWGGRLLPPWIPHAARACNKGFVVEVETLSEDDGADDVGDGQMHEVVVDVGRRGSIGVIREHLGRARMAKGIHGLPKV